jgi:hypothetical protein
MHSALDAVLWIRRKGKNKFMGLSTNNFGTTNVDKKNQQAITPVQFVLGYCKQYGWKQFSHGEELKKLIHY